MAGRLRGRCARYIGRRLKIDRATVAVVARELGIIARIDANLLPKIMP